MNTIKVVLTPIFFLKAVKRYVLNFCYFPLLYFVKIFFLFLTKWRRGKYQKYSSYLLTAFKKNIGVSTTFIVFMTNVGGLRTEDNWITKTSRTILLVKGCSS